MISLYPDQLEFVDDIRAAFRSHQSVLAQAPTGYGKCHGIDTPVILANGDIVMVQDVGVGDRLLAPDSGVRTVLALGRGR